MSSFVAVIADPLSCLKESRSSHHRTEDHAPPRALHFVAAGTAAAISSMLYNPLDCLRVRWQVLPVAHATTSTGTTLLSFGYSIVRNEGLVNGLWKPGMGPNATGMALSAAIRFGYYETVRDAIVVHSQAETKTSQHMVLAGLVCGSMGYILTTPFHYLKTMIQAEKGLLDSRGRYLSGSRMGKEPYVTDFFSGAERMIREGGVTSLYRGAVPLASRGGLFTAGQMMGYDGLKTLAKSNGYQDGTPLHIVSSMSASLGASLLSAPADFVMAKYMASKSQIRLMDCIRDVYAQNGITGFWRGWPISLFRLTPVMLTYSTLYEQIRKELGLGYFN